MSVAETAAWFEALYGRCTADDGEIIVSPKSKRETAKACRVGSTQALLDAAEAVAGKVDHYIKVNLMDADAMRQRAIEQQKGKSIVGNLSEVKTVVSFHLDCDAGKSDDYLDREEMLGCLHAMPVAPSLVINSDGPDGGFHVYWILREPYRIRDDQDRDYIGKLAKRWQAKLNELTGGHLDATADLTRFLRIAGQPRSNGNLVYAHEYDPGRLYSLRDLTIPAQSGELRSQAKRHATRSVRETLGPIKTLHDYPVPTYIDNSGLTVESLFSDEGWTELGNGSWMRPDSESGGRTAILATKLDRPGANFFSGNETRFPCHKPDGAPGRFHSIDKIFVEFRFGGDWKAASKWCWEQIDDQRLRVSA